MADYSNRVDTVLGVKNGDTWDTHLEEKIATAHRDPDTGEVVITIKIGGYTDKFVQLRLDELEDLPVHDYVPGRWSE